MNEYETVYVLKPDLPATHLQKVREKITKIFTEHQAQVVTENDWGKRKLAYRIDKFDSGHYIYCNYTNDGQVVAPLERTLKLDEGVIRFLTVKIGTGTDDPALKKVKKITEAEEAVFIVDDQSDSRGYDRGGYHKKRENRSEINKGDNHAPKN